MGRGAAEREEYPPSVARAIEIAVGMARSEEARLAPSLPVQQPLAAAPTQEPQTEPEALLGPLFPEEEDLLEKYEGRDIYGG